MHPHWKNNEVRGQQKSLIFKRSTCFLKAKVFPGTNTFFIKSTFLP